MKRLITLAVLLLSLTAGSLAIAAGGPGKFQTKITGNGAKTGHGMLDGTWTIDLNNPTSGKVNLTWNGESAGGGRYVISGSTITLTPKKNGNCKSKGRYKFKLSGSMLTFTPISDNCTERRDVLTFAPWKRGG